MSEPEVDGDQDGQRGGAVSALHERLDRIRTTPSRRRWATNAAILAGLVISAVHPLGLLVGGALTALPQRRLTTGLLGGLGFGLVALAAFGAGLAVQGALATALATGEIIAVSVATALVLPLLGSLIRGVL